MKTCDLCKNSFDKLRGSTIINEDMSFSSKNLCKDCYDSSLERTRQYLLSMGSSPKPDPDKYPEPVPHILQSPKWNLGNYKMDDEEIATFKYVFIKNYVKFTNEERFMDYLPEDVDIAPIYASLAYNKPTHFHVREADVTIKGCSLTGTQRYLAQQFLVEMTLSFEQIVKPQNIIGK